MPFFWKKVFFQTYKSKKQINNKPSLRELNSLCLLHRLSHKQIIDTEKRVSAFISKKILKAGLTVEAALVLPLFMFAVLSLISMFDIMKIKGCMDLAAVEVGNQISLEYYGGYVSDVTMPIYVRQKIKVFLKNNLAEKDFERIGKNIFVTGFSPEKEKNSMSFRIDYKITPDFGMLGLLPIKLSATYSGHKWLGYESDKPTEKMVFLSNTASVYHIDRNCTHMSVTIEDVLYENLNQYRNNNRQKYKSCSFCDDIENNGTVFITPEGNFYHNINNCLGLTRHIYTVPLSKVSSKNICTRCGE